MTEMTWTTMHIGGEITAPVLDELTELILDFFSEADLNAETIFKTAKTGAETIFMQGEVNYGNPEELKIFCQQHGLTYWLHYAAGHEWNPGIQVWNPSIGKEQECMAEDQSLFLPTIALDTLIWHGNRGHGIDKVITELSAFTLSKVPPLKLVAEAEAKTAVALG